MTPNVRRLQVPTAMLLPQFFEGSYEAAYRIAGDAVPKDARVINVTLGWSNTYKQPFIELMLESPSFSPVELGQEIPVLWPVFEISKETIKQRFPMVAEA